ncbi:hypothetical protein PanWU01x14_273480 [Parasponia andersonii]|uniref:Uncharacterized protein n=1 Tax=Parasponia andersonii TaxID=3476 RepID=A0A2P5B3W4_PARAD|nr:hypothetical protein PanWU01x14_273480 [Parasponia andersonii]
MWAKLKASKIKRAVEKEFRQVRKSLNVNEEYLNALRSKAYSDFLNKAKLMVNQHQSFSLYCHNKFSETLLEPGQESIPTILESALILSKIPELKTLLLKYFDISAEASNFCSHLLKGINQIQSNYLYVRGVLDEVNDHQDYSPENVKLIVSELNSLFLVGINPFSNPNKLDFKTIHEKYSSVLLCLKSMRKKVGKRIKLIKYVQNAFGICMTSTCGIITILAMFLAAHTLTVIFMGPAIFNFPFKCLAKKISSLPFLRSEFLRKVGDQLDLAAKGTYILTRDFDTISRLVASVHDVLEHNKAMLQSCLERKEYKICLHVVRELKKGDLGFRKQVEELEEHIYLCLVTINRARSLVIKEMIPSTTAHLDESRT